MSVIGAKLDLGSAPAGTNLGQETASLKGIRKMFVRHRVINGVIVVLVILMSGCATRSIQKVEAPESLDVLAASYTANQKSQDVALYASRILANDLAGARVVRDVIVQSVKKEIGIVYNEFERNLFAKKAAFEVETDIFELLLSTATTLTGAERARTNLSALLTATKGTRLSIDKNVFGEKTYFTLVSQMRASRSRVSASIFEKLARLDVIGYPLPEAEDDLVQLFNAGTIHEALVQLSTQSGAEAETQKKNEADAARIKLDPATQQQIAQITAIRNRFNDLFSKKDVTAARKILKALDSTVKDDLDESDVWKSLDAQIRKATDKSYLPTLVKAFGVS